MKPELYSKEVWLREKIQESERFAKIIEQENKLIERYEKIQRVKVSIAVGLLTMCLFMFIEVIKYAR